MIMESGGAWIDKHIVTLVDRYFGKCGLAEDALKELKSLPRGLARKIGGDESFWRQYISREDAATKRLNLIWGAVEKVGEQALANETKYGTSSCKYLERALNQEQMTNWIASLLRAMVPLGDRRS
jgi:hypothetical protein